MERYTTPVINYGCKRIPGLSEARQPKDITKEWFVYYKHISPGTGKYKAVKFKGGINRIHSLKERLEFAEGTRSDLHAWLSAGGNPFGAPVTERPFMLFSDALDFAVKIKKENTRHRSFLQSRNIANLIKKKAADMGLVMEVREVRRRHIKDIISSLQVENGFSNTRYNNIMAGIRGLFTVLLDEEIIEVHPLTLIKAKKESEPTAHKPLTDQEKAKLFTLYETHPRFFTFLMCIYYSGIRPEEILGLKVSDYQRGEVAKIPASVAKTGIARTALVDIHLRLLLDEHIRGAHPSAYLFSRDFKPGSIRMKRNTATTWWKEKVKADVSDGGLGIKKTMYGLKHTGANDKLKAGIPLDHIKEMFGHTTPEMTENYTTEKTEIMFNQIRGKIPGFVSDKDGEQKGS